MQHEFNLFLQICLFLAKINFVFLTLTTWSALYYLQCHLPHSLTHCRFTRWLIRLLASLLLVSFLNWFVFSSPPRFVFGTFAAASADCPRALFEVDAHFQFNFQLSSMLNFKIFNIFSGGYRFCWHQFDNRHVLLHLFVFRVVLFFSSPSRFLITVITISVSSSQFQVWAQQFKSSKI